MKSRRTFSWTVLVFMILMPLIARAQTPSPSPTPIAARSLSDNISALSQRAVSLLPYINDEIVLKLIGWFELLAWVFGNCLAGLWPLAARRGVTRETFEGYTAGLTPDLRLMDLLDAQPEFTKSTWDYLDALVSDERIARGREILAQHAPTFAAVERTYGVDRHVIAAIWGVESKYSTMGGDRSVIRSTATLACVGRRRDFFREEFLSALEILQRGVQAKVAGVPVFDCHYGTSNGKYALKIDRLLTSSSQNWMGDTNVD